MAVIAAVPIQLLLVDQEQRVWPLAAPVTIGSAPDNTIVLEDPRVAQRHAMIEPRDGQLHVRDLGSRDGTYVRGQRIQKEAPVAEGDEIIVGVECFRISRAVHVDERELLRLRAAAAITRCLSTDLQLDQVLAQVLATLGDVLALDRCSLVLLEGAAHDEPHRTTWTRHNEPEPAISTTMIREALTSNKGLIVNDVVAHTRDDHDHRVSIACLPLRRAGKELGVLYVDTRRSRTPFTRGDLDTLASIACQVTVVVENALLRASLLERTVRAEEATRHKTEFLRNMSHELRTPLTGIVGFAELLDNGVAGQLSELQREFVGDILGSSRHLVEIIAELLDLSAVESGHITLSARPLDLRVLVEEVCKSLRPIATAAGIEVTTQVDPAIGTVHLDSTRVRQVIYNFVSNAIKFTASGGKVTVRVAPEGSDELRIEVEDNGIGIQREDLPRVFVDAVRFEPGRKFSGVGLGLVLARRLVEAHGGRVGVQSVRDRGSIFTAIFPRAKR